MARPTKRLWTDEEKRSICLQTTAPGVCVARVAQRYAMNANMTFKWLRDPSYASEPVGGTGCGVFFPSSSWIDPCTVIGNSGFVFQNR